MSAFDVAGAVVWTPLAVLFWIGALTPSNPPHPPYSEREYGCFIAAIFTTIAAIFCIARLNGASL